MTSFGSCPECENLMDKYEGTAFHGFPSRYKAIWLCDICGHMMMVNHDGTIDQKLKDGGA